MKGIFGKMKKKLKIKKRNYSVHNTYRTEEEGRVIFNKALFQTKYVEAEKRVPIDTLFLIGNGFDIWQGLNTRFDAFEKYYEEHIEEVLSRLHLKVRILLDKEGTPILDKEGKQVKYSDVEVFYSNPNNPQRLSHEFWNSFEVSLDKIDDQEINYFFGRDGVSQIQTCANNAQRILREIFCDWVTSIKIDKRESNYHFGKNVLFVNFNYTDTLLKRFDVNEMNEYHIHGNAIDKDSIVVGHSAHPELPYEPIRNFKDKPRLQGLYYIEEFLYHADKHVEDNYMKLRIFCALHGVRIEDIKKIYVLGFGYGEADLGYIKHLIHATEGIQEQFESDLNEEEKYYLDTMDSDNEKMLNMNYAGTHRERIMQREPIRYPKLEKLDEYMYSILEEPYYHISKEERMKLDAAAVRRRFWAEQKARNEKIQREYLRMLNKTFKKGYLSPEEACLEADKDTLKNLKGAEWHISYFSTEDKDKIEAVMTGYGCKNYTLYQSIDDCIKEFE